MNDIVEWARRLGAVFTCVEGEWNCYSETHYDGVGAIMTIDRDAAVAAKLWIEMFFNHAPKRICGICHKNPAGPRAGEACLKCQKANGYIGATGVAAHPINVRTEESQQ